MAEVEVGVDAAKPAFGQQDRGLGGGLAEATGGSLDQHVGEARFERQAGDSSTVSGDAASLVDRSEGREAAAGLGQRGSGGRVEEREPGGVAFAPQKAGEEKARQVRLEDLGRIVGRERAGRGLFPQAVGGARALAGGAAGALSDGGLARALGHQPGEAGVAVVTGAAGKP